MNKLGLPNMVAKYLLSHRTMFSSYKINHVLVMDMLNHNSYKDFY